MSKKRCRNPSPSLSSVSLSDISNDKSSYTSQRIKNCLHNLANAERNSDENSKSCYCDLCSNDNTKPKKDKKKACDTKNAKRRCADEANQCAPTQDASQTSNKSLINRISEIVNQYIKSLRSKSTPNICRKCKTKSPRKVVKKCKSASTPIPLCVEMRQIIARRHEIWHEKFLTYQEIINYIRRLQQEYKNKISLHHICWTREKRALYMVKIKNCQSKTVSAVMVDAGSNACQLMTVSAAIFLIDFLVKNNMILLMEYFIIPCLNPDAYDAFLTKGRKKQVKTQTPVDLSKAFPRQLQETPCPTIFAENNCYYLLQLIQKYKECIVLYISLQSSEDAITYPMENYINDHGAFAQAAKIAMQKTIAVRPAIYSLDPLYYSVIEYVRCHYPKSIKFAYNVNIYDSDLEPDCSKILDVGAECLVAVTTLVKKVYKNYVKQKCS